MANIEEKRINRHLIRRTKEIYKKIINTVSIDFTKKFWTNAGVRQGCPLSLILFTTYTGCFEIKCQHFGNAWGLDKLKRKVMQRFARFYLVSEKIAKKQKQKLSFSYLCIYLHLHLLYYHFFSKDFAQNVVLLQQCKH